MTVSQTFVNYYDMYFDNIFCTLSQMFLSYFNVYAGLFSVLTPYQTLHIWVVYIKKKYLFLLDNMV